MRSLYRKLCFLTIAASKALDLELWHCCFGHLGIDVVKQLINQDMVDGLVDVHGEGGNASGIQVLDHNN